MIDCLTPVLPSCSTPFVSGLGWAASGVSFYCGRELTNLSENNRLTDAQKKKLTNDVQWISTAMAVSSSFWLISTGCAAWSLPENSTWSVYANGASACCFAATGIGAVSLRETRRQQFKLD